MKSKFRYSRREVVRGMINLLESGVPAKRVASILSTYLFTTNQTRNIELYLRDIEIEIANRFDKTTAHVASARQLGPETKKRIKQLIKDKYNTKDVELIEDINPRLIGGIIITTADSELDGSIQTKLQQLRSI